MKRLHKLLTQKLGRSITEEEMEEFREAVRKDKKQEILDEIDKNIKHYEKAEKEEDENVGDRMVIGQCDGAQTGLDMAKQIINKYL